MAAQKQPNPSTNRISIIYAHEDEVWKDRLERHLNVLAKQGLAKIWVDRGIYAGVDWQEQVLTAIDSSRVVVVLVSADSLGSDFIQDVEVPRILKRQRNGQAIVVPVLVRACAWQAVQWLRRLQMRPKDAVPLAFRRGHRQEAAIAAIAEEILERLVNWSAQTNARRSQSITR